MWLVLIYGIQIQFPHSKISCIIATMYRETNFYKNIILFYLLIFFLYKYLWYKFIPSCP